MQQILVHPTYFPSIVQMVAVCKAEAIYFEKEDNYQKQTYRNRAYIAHTNGKLLLNVPIKHSKNGERQLYKEVQPEDSFPWQSQHWKSLQTAYRTSPFFEFYEDDIAPLFQQEVSNLYNHNIQIFNLVCELIGITPNIFFTEEYFREPSQHDLRYLVVAKKEKTYPLTPYRQVLEAHHPFLSNLSILDLLFNEGPNTLEYLETQDLNL